MTLHTLNRSSFSFDVSGLLRAAGEGDVLLLIEDGVYTALDANTLDRVRDAGMEVRLLEPDVAARGVGERLPGSLGLVDYAGFVALVCDTDKTVAWF